jgi:hypothetical protein
MKKLVVLMLLSPAASLAQSPFDGTWIIDTNTAQLPEKPIVYFLAKGVLRCSDCFASPEVKADGYDQKVLVTSYWKAKPRRHSKCRSNSSNTDRKSANPFCLFPLLFAASQFSF